MRARGAPLRAGLCFAGLSLLLLVPPARADETPAEANGLTIEQASRLAQSSSEAIRIRELAVQKARLAVSEAEGKRLPHVDLGVAASYLVQPPTGYTVAAGSLGAINIPALGVHTPMPTQDFSIGAHPYNYFSASATLSQPLFTWGKIRNAIDITSLRAESAGTDLLAQRRVIQREVRRAYYGALLAQESEAVLRQIAVAAAQIVSDRQASLEQGSLTGEAVLEAQSRRAQIEARLAEAAQSRATALESLGILTGLDPQSITLASGFPAEAADPSESAIRARALDASTDVAESRTRQRLAQKKLALEQGGAILRPDVAFGVSLAASGQQNYLVLNGAPPNSTAPTSWSWDVILSLNVKMSVFDGMESASRIAQAEKDTEAAGLALRQSEKLTRLAARRAVDAALKAEADLSEMSAREEYAAERLKNARVSADNGMASREDLHGAEILFGSAQLDSLLARFTREEALADLSHLSGELP
jgi:outer membrane protein